MKKAIQFLFLFALCSAVSVGLYGQDTLIGEVPDGVLLQHCGLNEVFVSKSLAEDFVVAAADQVVVKSSDKVVLKPGFKAGNWTIDEGGVFIARIATDCSEEMVWDGEESSDWNNPKNWESFGVPTQTDNVIIVNAPNVPKYSGTEGVKGLSMEGNALDLATNLTVAEILSLTDGIIRAGTNTLVLGDALTVSGGSNASYIEGYVTKEGTTSFTFPIGDVGFYRPIEISAPASNGVYQVVYHEENSDDLFPHSAKEDTLNAISTTGYWEFDKVSGPDVSVALGYDLLHSCGITDASDIRVVAWAGSQWTDQGRSNFAGTEESGSVTSGTALAVNGPLTYSVSEVAELPVGNGGGDKTILYSQSVSLGGSPTVSGIYPPYETQWFRAGELISSEGNPLLELDETTNLTLIARDVRGCFDRENVVVEVNPSLTVDFSDLQNSLVEDQLQIQINTSQLDEVVYGGVASFNFDLAAQASDEVAVALSSALVEEESFFKFSLDGLGNISNVRFSDTDEHGIEVEEIPLSEEYFSLGAGRVSFFLNGDRNNVTNVKDEFTITLYQGVLMTPNSDGENDVLGFLWNELPDSYSLVVEDLSGNILFESSDPDEFWDGTVSNSLVPVGNFNYHLALNGQTISGQFIINY